MEKEKSLSRDQEMMEKTQAAKQKPYLRPILIEYGDVTVLTQNSDMGSASDGMDMKTMQAMEDMDMM
jgi:hypothetical protein